MIIYKKENRKVSTAEKFKIITITLEYACSLRWRLEVIFDWDYSNNKKDNSVDNLIIIRKIVLLNAF